MTRKLMFKDPSAQVDRSAVLGQCSPDGQCGDLMNGVHQKSTSYVRRLTYKNLDNQRDDSSSGRKKGRDGEKRKAKRKGKGKGKGEEERARERGSGRKME